MAYIQMAGVGRRHTGEADVRTKRFKEIGRRFKRTMAARKRGSKVRGVIKAGLKAAAVYGHRARGMAPKHRRILRSMVNAGLPGAPKGKDLL